jgi:hypothetical protein
MIDLTFMPEVRLRDGRIIRDLEDAIGFVREHELRPGVDCRDEVLHALERAKTATEAKAAAEQFLSWLAALELAE